MPITLPNGAKTPTPSDPYNLTADMLKLAKSLNLPVIVASAEDRDNIPDKYDGLTVTRTDKGGIQQTYSGGIWYGSRISGAAFGHPVVPAGGSTTINITYPPGIFPGVPRPVVTPGSGRLQPGIFNLTANGFSMTLDNYTSAAASAGTGVWMAIYGVL